MRQRGRPHDGQAEAGTARLLPVPAARGVEPDEPVKGPLPVLRRDAGAVIGHAEHHVVTFAPRRHAHPGFCVTQRVLDEVPEHSPQPVGVAGDDAAVAGARGHRHSGPGAAPGLLGGQGREVHRASARRRPRAPVIEPGQHQQVLSEPGQPQRVGQHVAGGLGPVLLLRMVQRHLELGPDARDRAAQFVRGVRDQVALALLGVVQAGQHVVQRDREHAHLVAGFGHRQLTGLPGSGDHLSAAAQGGDRAQRVPDHQPGDPGQEQQQHRCAHQQHPGHGRHGVGHRLEGDPGDHDLTVAGTHCHGPHQVRDVVRPPVEQDRPSRPGVGGRLSGGQQRDHPVRGR